MDTNLSIYIDHYIDTMILFEHILDEGFNLLRVVNIASHGKMIARINPSMILRQICIDIF